VLAKVFQKLMAAFPKPKQHPVVTIFRTEDDLLVNALAPGVEFDIVDCVNPLVPGNN